MDDGVAVIKTLQGQRRVAEKDSRMAFQELTRCVGDGSGLDEALRNDTKARRVMMEARDRLRNAEGEVD